MWDVPRIVLSYYCLNDKFHIAATCILDPELHW